MAKTIWDPQDVQVMPFDYAGVRLNDGRLKLQMNEVRALYLGLPNDSLLKGFRVRAGLSAPGTSLGGWYGSDGFHTFGQIVSGLARMYAATGEEACRDKVNTLVAEWAKCIAADGYFYYSSQPNAPHYTYDKTVCGLIDANLYCGNTQALTCLEKITDWAIAHLDRTRAYAYNAGDGNTEWYTLSENLYRAYLVTGNSKYLDFANVWKYEDFWFLFDSGTDIFARLAQSTMSRYHAYSHVNSLNGLGSGYLVNHSAKYLSSLTEAYDYLHDKQEYATGGFGPAETLLPWGEFVASIKYTHAHFETQCGSWAAFKMAKYLVALTGDARYGDWVERLLLNGIGASIPMDQAGNGFYYSDYSGMGGAKTLLGYWTCCTGTRVQAVADYVDQIFFRKGNDLYVVQFVPSTVDWAVGAQTAHLTQATQFPESAKVEFTINVASPAAFALRVRRPGWLEQEAVAQLNGQPIQATADNNHWYVFNRTWADGDRLTLELPMSLKFERLDPAAQYPGVLRLGPVTLAISGETNPASQINPANPADSLTTRAGQPLTYALVANPSRTVQPFYRYGAGEPYYLYLDPTLPDYKFVGGWFSNAGLWYTPYKDTTVSFTFQGIGVRWLGQRFDDGGRIEVRIDGRLVAVVDQYAPGRGLPFVWESPSLPNGRHTIELRNTGVTPPDSKGTYINLTAFEVIASQGKSLARHFTDYW